LSSDISKSTITSQTLQYQETVVHKITSELP